jgi:hypothetical protein
METFSFLMAHHNYAIHIFNSLIGGVKQLVYKDTFETSIMEVKDECSITTNMFIIELDPHFVDSKLVNAIGIRYAQF